MIERSISRFDLCPAKIMGDSAYGSAEMLGWLVYEHGIEPHVTVFESRCARTVHSHATTSPTTMSAMPTSAQIGGLRTVCTGPSLGIAAT
jgi:hypothetical protein